jgi:hypothetical protein
MLVGCKKCHQMDGGYHGSSLGYITMDFLKYPNNRILPETPHNPESIYEVVLIHNRSSQKNKNRI